MVNWYGLRPINHLFFSCLILIWCFEEIEKINFISNLNEKLLCCHSDRREETGDS